MSSRWATGTFGGLAMAAAMAGCGHAAAAPGWQQLGPPGGPVVGWATGPAGSGKVYALSRDSGYLSEDGGLSWRVAPPKPDGSLGVWVRGDGQVFLSDRRGTFWRSADDMRTWESYVTPEGGWPVFDPRNFQDAVVVYGTGHATRSGDADNWHIVENAPDTAGPAACAFDPAKAGGLFGVGVGTTRVCAGTTCQSYATLNLFASEDKGATWADRGRIVPTNDPNHPDPPLCAAGGIAVDAAGRLFIRTSCSALRSTDGGTTWQVLTGRPPEDWQYSSLLMDPATPGRLLLYGFVDGRFFESLDAGDSWRRLPSPPGMPGFGSEGELWAASANGLLRYDPAQGRWLPRSSGLNATRVHQVEPGAGGGGALTAILLPEASAMHSLDDGLTWRPLTLAGAAVVDITRHATDPAHLLAQAASAPSRDSPAAPMFASHDGGATWQPVPTPLALPGGNRVSRWVPAGAGDGLVYGLENAFTCPMMSAVCYWKPATPAKSLDGGKTWAAAAEGIAGTVERLVVSPADPDSVVAFQDYRGAVYLTRDGARTWTQVLKASDFDASVTAAIPDGLDPARWYLQVIGGSGIAFLRTDDAGASWRTLADAGLASPWNNLLVAGGRAYAIAANGAVATSDDGGTTWSRIVDGQADIPVATGTARWGTAGATIYAGGPLGVLKLDLAAAAVQPRDGLWVINGENDGRSGRGLQLETRNRTLAFTYFGYDGDGSGRWYLAAGPLQDARFAAGMVACRGGTVLGGAPNDAVAAGSAGEVALSFSSPTTGTVTLPGEPARAITKFAFGGATAPALVPAGGLWIIEAESTGASGRGFHIEHSGGELVFTYFGYDQDGNGARYLAAGSLSGDRFAAPLTAYRGGTVLGGAYAPAAPGGSPGEVRLTFSGPAAGTITLPGEPARAMRKFTW